ncbi:hypothetical protein BH20ACT11_BH20ACT11_00320 [soil metagenome]|jgi:hypothetical protein
MANPVKLAPKQIEDFLIGSSPYFEKAASAYVKRGSRVFTFATRSGQA